MKGLRLHSILLLTTGLFLVVPHFAFAGFNEFLQDAVFNIVMGILGMFVWLSALLLNFAVNNFIIGFGNTFATTGVGVAVDNTWVIVRDFVNLGFIFGFVYIGFKMILSSSDSNTRRWLVNIILAALLVNFSLFVVKFAIDVSNQLAAQIAINGLGSTCTDASCTTKDGLRQIDIASEFMARLGLSKVFSLTYETVNGAGWGYIFGSALLSLTAMFVFAAGGILIIIRFAVLCLFMVLSPIMFLSWILPPVKDTFERFWSMFIGRAFFAPVYLLFIYFSLQIISGLQKSVGGSTGGFGNPDWAGTFQGAGKLDAQGNAVLTLGTFPFFVLAMIFMGASLVIANKLGADFGDKAVGMGKSFGNRVRSATTGSARWAGAQTGGRLARAGSNVAGNALQRGLRGAQQLQGDGMLASATRRIARMNGVQGAVTGAATSMRDARFGLSQTREQDRQTRNQTNSQADRAMRQRADANTAPITAASTDAEITARQEARRRQQGEVRDMSTAEILERARTDRAGLMSPEFASLLTDAQVTALRDSGILTNEDMDTLEERRDEGTFAEITEILENGNASTENLTAAMDDLNRIMSTMSDDRRQGMMRFDDAGNLRGPLANGAIASRLSAAHIDNMRQSGRAGAAQMDLITNSRRDGLVRIAQTGSLGNAASPGGSDAGFQDRQRRGMFRNPQDAGRLPAAVLRAQESAEYLTPRIIEEFLSTNPNPQDLDDVRRNISLHLLRNPGQRDTWRDWTNSRVDGRRFGLIIP